MGLGFAALRRAALAVQAGTRVQRLSQRARELEEEVLARQTEADEEKAAAVAKARADRQAAEARALQFEREIKVAVEEGRRGAREEI